MMDPVTPADQVPATVAKDVQAANNQEEELWGECPSVFVTLKMKGETPARKLEIRAFDGETRDNYMVESSEHFRKEKGPDGKEKEDDRYKPGIFEILLTKCLHENNQVLTAEQVRKLPAKTQQKLFDMALDLNGMGGGKAKEEAKNV